MLEFPQVMPLSYNRIDLSLLNVVAAVPLPTYSPIRSLYVCYEFATL